MPSVNAGIETFHVDGTTVFGVVLKCLAVEWIAFTFTIIGLTDDSLLTATEDLEGIAFIQVDGRTTPYLGVFSIAAAEHVQGST